MKEGWEYKTLGECCEKINGLWKGKKEPFVNIGVIRNANFTKEMTLDFSNIEYLDVEVKQYNTRKLKRGDLIVEKSGGSEKQPVGRAVLFLKEDGDYSFSNFTSVLRIINKDELLYEFLYKFLLYIYRRGDTKSMQKATTGIHNIEFEKYLNIQVPIIPKYQQRRIVSYLDSSFKLIDEIKEKAQKSLLEAKALFQSALAEAMEPKEGWEEKTLGDVGSFKRGGNFTKRDFIEDGFPCVHYGQIHMKFGHITKQHISCVPKELVKKDRCAKKGDLIIAITSEDDEGSCKCTAWMANYEVYVGGHTAIYTHNLDPIFMSYFFQSPRFQKEKLEYTHGFKVVEINPKDIAKIPIFYPPLSTQKQIVSHLDKLSSNVKQMEDRYKKMVEECDALKQAMLRDVFE